MSQKWKNYESSWNRDLVQTILDPILLFTIKALSEDIIAKSGHILDIWCGEWGFYTEWIYSNLELRKFLTYRWIDISKTSFTNKVLWLLSGGKYNISQWDGQQKLPFTKESFDLAMSKLVIHNFSNLDEHFKHVSNILKPQWIYLIAVLDSDYITQKIWRELEIWEKLEYPIWKAGMSFTYYFQTREGIIEYATRNWFKDMKVEVEMSYSWTNIPSLKENYPQAFQQNPFDFIMLKKIV